MTRLYAILLLTACSCTSAPIAADAQARIDAIRATYFRAAMLEEVYAQQPPCRLSVQTHCFDGEKAQAVRERDYAAAGAIVTANMRRTRDTLDAADTKAREFAKAAEGL